MAMATEVDQSAVAYRTSPDGPGSKGGMPDGKKQFGKGNRMPQDNGSAPQGHAMKEHVGKMHSRHGRHKEHR